MSGSRAFFFVVLLILVAAGAWYYTSHRTPAEEHVTIYYTKDDGSSEVPWTITVRARQAGETDADRMNYLTLYAASQAVAGPPSTIAAIRFPAGTHVVAATVAGSTATIDLSSEAAQQSSGTSSESGEFKSLVWTLTALPGIDAVAVRVAGKKVATLPGGNFELDEPLRRSDW